MVAVAALLTLGPVADIASQSLFPRIVKVNPIIPPSQA